MCGRWSWAVPGWGPPDSSTIWARGWRVHGYGPLGSLRLALYPPFGIALNVRFSGFGGRMHTHNGGGEVSMAEVSTHYPNHFSGNTYTGVCFTRALYTLSLDISYNAYCLEHQI